MKYKHKVAYMKSAFNFAECSNATRLQVGAILVNDGGIIAEGYNGLPLGMSGSCEDGSGNTLKEVIHAEDNALRKVTRKSISSVGSIMFCTHSPCLQCAIKLVDAGVKEVYYAIDYRNRDGVEWLMKNEVIVNKLEV